MRPWLHMWTELQHINHGSQSVACYLWLFVWFPVCAWECVSVFHHVVHLPAARGSVCLLDRWQAGVLFITWWRVTDDSLYESMHVYRRAHFNKWWRGGGADVLLWYMFLRLCLFVCPFVYFMCVSETGKKRQVENLYQSKQSKRSQEEEKSEKCFLFVTTGKLKHWNCTAP